MVVTGRMCQAVHERKRCDWGFRPVGFDDGGTGGGKRQRQFHRSFSEQRSIEQGFVQGDVLPGEAVGIEVAMGLFHHAADFAFAHVLWPGVEEHGLLDRPAQAILVIHFEAEAIAGGCLCVEMPHRVAQTAGGVNHRKAAIARRDHLGQAARFEP